MLMPNLMCTALFALFVVLERNVKTTFYRSQSHLKTRLSHRTSMVQLCEILCDTFYFDLGASYVSKEMIQCTQIE